MFCLKIDKIYVNLTVPHKGIEKTPLEEVFDPRLGQCEGGIDFQRDLRVLLCPLVQSVENRNGLAGGQRRGDPKLLTDACNDGIGTVEFTSEGGGHEYR